MIFNRTTKYQFKTRLHLSDTILEPITEMKLVGVWITSDLSWAKNTSEICRKAFARLSLITKLMYVGVGTEELISIYIIFIRSLVENCCVVWHSTLTVEQEDDLEQIQKVCLHVIFGECWVDYDTALEMTGLEKLVNRREKMCLSFAEKCLSHKKHKNMFPPKDFNEMVPKYGHLHNVRQREKFIVNPAGTERYRMSTIPYLQRLLNDRNKLHQELTPE